jgi:predicted enzyme related to lactoylglutathione lyase
MKRVQGIGGIFFKAKDPTRLNEWYAKHLGISPLAHSPWGEEDTAPLFEWRDTDDAERKCYTVFGVFPDDTNYFDPGKAPFMFNFRVDDLDAVLDALREEGVQIIGEIKAYDYGRFARIIDLEGNPVELWEPAEGF